MAGRRRPALGWVGVLVSLLSWPITATTSETAWSVLIDRDSGPAWRGWTSPGLPAGWHIEEGVLAKRGEVDDLVSVRSYRSFELEFEWKLSKGGNAGIFYRGTRAYDHIYWSAPEYQLLDDAGAADGDDRLAAVGAAYGLYASPVGTVSPFDHWNRSRLVVRGSHVEHWLNGRKVVEYELLSDEWYRRVAASKFAKYPGYGRAAQGFVGIQGDHEGDLALRAMRIRELR